MSMRRTGNTIALLALGVVSARAGINLLEIVDCLLGFVGMDIAGDDERSQENPVSE